MWNKNQYIEKLSNKTKTIQLRRVHFSYEFIHGCTESLALSVYIVLCYTAHRNIVVANNERCFDIRLFSQFYLPRTRIHIYTQAARNLNIAYLQNKFSPPNVCTYYSSEDSVRLAYFCYCVFAACLVSRGRIAANAFLELKIHIYRRRWRVFRVANCMCMDCDDHDDDDVEAKTKQIKSQFEIKIIFMLLLSTHSSIRLHSQSVDDLL